MKLLDLFSGIGGFSLGAEAHGIETIGFVEKDPFCQRVLKKHWPDVPIESDIRNVKGENYGATDIISGGFPCQPFSVAGKRKGTDDDRYLWDETIRVVAECKPRWFIGENVEGLINIQDGMVLRQVQDDLEKEGFQVQCLVIPASGIGAWHQRKRIWIIGYSNSNANAKEKQRGNGAKDSISKEYWSKDSSVQYTGGTTNNSLSNSSSRQLTGSSSNATRICNTKQERWLDSNQKEIRNKVWSKVERCSEQDSWWERQIKSELLRVPNGISYELDKDRSNRLKSLGNSIVPEIAYLIGKSIVAAEYEK